MERGWYWLVRSSASKDNRLYGAQMVLARQILCQQREYTIWSVDGTGSLGPVPPTSKYYMERSWYWLGGSGANKEHMLYGVKICFFDEKESDL